MGVFRGTDGSIQYFTPAQEAHARSQGFVPVSAAEAGQETGAIDDARGGLAGGLNAVTTSALSGATLGLSDVGLNAILSDSEMAGVRADRAAHPYLSGASAAVGAIAPAILSGGASLPSSLAARAGTGVAEGLGGGLLARAAGGAAEGALFGAGQGVSELAIDSDPLTWERAASAIGSNALFGAAVGGGVSLAGSAVERGLTSAKNAIDARLAGVAKDGKILAVDQDLLTLDSPGLKEARKAEVQKLEDARAPVRQNAIEELDSYRNINRDSDWMRASTDRSQGATRDISEAGASFVDADIKLRRALDNRSALAENPKRALYQLQQQQQALEEIIPWGEAQSKAWHADVDAAPAKIRAQIIAREVPGEIGPFTPAGLDAATERVLAERQKLTWGPGGAFKDGLKEPVISKYAADFKQIAERNRQLQEQFKGLVTPVQSERLTAIDAAQEQLSVPQKKSVGERLLSHVPGGGLVGELVGLGSRATGGLRRAAAATAEKTSKAIGSFLGTAEKVAPAVIPTATHVLGNVRFGAGPAPKSGELHDLFTARAAELRQQTMVAPDGSIQMRPDARRAITAKLVPVAAVNPVLADRIETTLARRTAYMSSKIPKRPEVGGIQIGPDTWRPSDLQIRSWARTVRACEDPDGVEERLAQGTVTPEESSAYRACFPARYAALQQSILAAVPMLAKTLSPKKKVALFTMTGIPTMAALQPNVIKVLQATFATEPGTAGGTAAPKPMPAFGAMGSAKSMDQPTPAQKRGG